MSLLQRIYESLVHRQLRTLRKGHLIMIDRGRVYSFGDEHSPLQAIVQIHSPRFYRRLALGGGIGAADALIDGDWTCDDLTMLVRIFIRNETVSGGFDRGVATVRAAMSRWRHALRRNTRGRARENIRQHYDLSNAFFAKFLDPTLAYSSGVYQQTDDTLRDASIAKFDRLCRKLDLRPTDHLLEIGSGWGGLAVYAARHFGCRVTTTTISREQFQFTRQRVEQNGLQDRITVLQQDYRELQGCFDKIVSVEMIEAVGHEYFDTFFHNCDQLLRPDGMLALQAIVIRDQRYRDYLRSVDFIRTHIFPGGCLPSVSALLQSTARSSQFRMLHLEDIAPHYAHTLRDWRAAFHLQREAIEELGFDVRFQRMWEYYLCYCEAAFEERHVNAVQVLLAKPACRFDPIGLQFADQPESALFRNSDSAARAGHQAAAARTTLSRQAPIPPHVFATTRADNAEQAVDDVEPAELGTS